MTKLRFFMFCKLFTALNCSEYRVALMTMMLFKSMRGFMLCIRSMLKVFSVSMKMTFPCACAVAWKQKVVFPVEGEP